MAVPRILSRGRCLFARTTPSVRVAQSAVPLIRTSITKREFAASQLRRENIIETPSRGPEIALTDARAPTSSASSGVALLGIPKRLTRGEVEDLLRSKGCTVKRLQMRLDRYSFQNDTRCFAELGSEAEAAKVIAELNDTEIQRKKLIVRPLKDDFVWGPVQEKQDHKYATRYFFDEGPAAALEAVRPLLEGRRLMVRVQTPGWTSNASIARQKQNALRILEEQFAKHGTIERFSDFAPFYGDKKKEPRILCFIDFATKEGADKAIENIHDTQIEGRLTWLMRSETNQYRSHQIGKVAPEALKQLQERGVAPKDEELHEDKFVNPLPKKE